MFCSEAERKILLARKKSSLLNIDDELVSWAGREVAWGIFMAGHAKNANCPGFQSKRHYCGWREWPQEPSQPIVTSSVQTLKLASVLGPNVVAMATSIASRPLAINTRPIRGTLLRASKVYQRPPR